jgi:hypothetical protein
MTTEKAIEWMQAGQRFTSKSGKESCTLKAVYARLSVVLFDSGTETEVTNMRIIDALKQGTLVPTKEPAKPCAASHSSTKTAVDRPVRRLSSVKAKRLRPKSTLPF